MPHQAVRALDDHLLSHWVPPLFSGVDAFRALGRILPTGSPRSVTTHCWWFVYVLHVTFVPSFVHVDVWHLHALSLRHRWGHRRLDELLGGGFREGQVTELVGESGSGKTQARAVARLRLWLVLSLAESWVINSSSLFV